MSAIEQKIQAVMPYVMGFVNSKPVKAIKDGFLYTMPLTIIGSIFLLLAFLPIPGYGDFMAGVFGPEWQTPLWQVVGSTFDVLALIGVFGIAYSWVRNEGLDGVSAGIFAIISLLILNDNFVTTADGTTIGGVIPKAYMGGKGMIVAIFIGIFVGWLFTWCTKKKWVITMPEGVPQGVANAFSALIPGAVIMFSSFFIWLFFNKVFDQTLVALLYEMLQAPLQGLSDSLGGVIIVALLISLLWWCGVHGSAIVMGIMGPIVAANGLQNQDILNGGGVLIAGENAKIVTNQFVDQYLTFGGAGLTLGLVVSMLMFSKSAQFKDLGRIGIMPGLFNINEPIIFAFPVVFNPFMLIPFIAAPIISVFMVYFSISSGLVAPFTAIGVPWTTPMIISGFIVGGWKAATLQVAVFLMSVCVYYPFMKAQDNIALKNEKQHKNDESIDDDDALALQL
ncbi:MAG: PTS sugar transporter subunit IIC [Aeromonas sp.]